MGITLAAALGAATGRAQQSPWLCPAAPGPAQALPGPGDLWAPCLSPRERRVLVLTLLGSFIRSEATVELTWELRSFDGIPQRDTGLLTSKTSQSCKPTADSHLEPAPQLPPVLEGGECPRAPREKRVGGLGSPEASSGVGRPWL